MKPLIPKTVYVEATVYVNNGTECSEVEKREIFLKKENQYILTKEELIELLRDTWEDGILTFMSNMDKETAKTQFINNLLNQQ